MAKEEVEVIKVVVPKKLAEKFRKYVAEKYGLRKGALSKAVQDIIRKELGYSAASGDVGSLVGLGLKSPYKWEGEDLAEALRRKRHVPA